MTGLTVKEEGNGGSASPRADVGEIDTRAPFQSVKAAVTLFRDVGSLKAPGPITKKSKAEERVLEKETQHHMMMRERGYYMNHMKSAEAAKANALRELQRANVTLKQLTSKLEALSVSKQASIKATEKAKVRVKELEEQRAWRAQLGDDAWKVEVNNERERYKAVTAELLVRKQELSNLRQDFNAASAVKMVVFQKAEDEQRKAQMNLERETQLQKEADELRQALEHLKLASVQAEEEYSKIMEEKENKMQSCKLAKEEAEKEIERLREEYEPAETLQEKLEETLEAIRVLQEKLNEIKSSGWYILRTLASELDSAKMVLEDAVAEENSLRSVVDSYEFELEEVKKKLQESEKKGLEAESNVEKMQAELEKKKAEVESAISGSAYVLQSSIGKLLAETERAGHEAEDCRKEANLLKKEAKAARTETKEAEEKLKVALKEAEEAKAAEKLAEEKVHAYARNEAARLQGSVPEIRLSVEEFDLMNKKIEEYRNQADLEVATAMAQVEAINAREREIKEKLDEMLNESDTIQSEIDDALKRAENAEAAKRIVESEPQKWHRNEKHAVGKLSKRKLLYHFLDI